MMQTTMIIFGLILIAFGIFLYLRNSKLMRTPMANDHEKILHLTDKNFVQHTNEKLVLVDFWAAWCAPCRMMAPVLNEVALELKGNQQIGKVDVEKFQSLAKKYKVQGIPTLILFKNGVEINRFVGVKSKEFLLKQMVQL